MDRDLRNASLCRSGAFENILECGVFHFPLLLLQVEPCFARSEFYFAQMPVVMGRLLSEDYSLPCFDPGWKTQIHCTQISIFKKDLLCYFTYLILSRAYVFLFHPPIIRILSSLTFLFFR